MPSTMYMGVSFNSRCCQQCIIYCGEHLPIAHAADDRFGIDTSEYVALYSGLIQHQWQTNVTRDYLRR